MRFETQLTVLSAASGFLALFVFAGGAAMFGLAGDDHPLDMTVVTIGVCMVLFTLFEAALSISLATKLRGHIRTLSEGAKRFVSEKGVRLPVMSGELGDYAVLFNRMADQVERVHENLEDEVRARTVELKASNASLLAILNSAGESSAVINTDTEVMRVNRRAVEILGYENEGEMVGRKWCDVVFPKRDGRKITPKGCPVIRAMNEAETRFAGIGDGVSYRGRRPGDFPVQSTASPLIVDGKVTGAVVVFRDITEETAIDEAKTDFVSLASHQLRTPLSSINWYTEVLAMEMKPGHEVSEEWVQYVKTIEASSRRMVNLVNSLLNVSRIETDRVQVTPREIDIAVIVDRVISDLKFHFRERKPRIIRRYEEKRMMMSGDPSVVEVVAMNLISNAIKYCGEGGCRIDVSLKRDDEGRMVMTVKDNGIGIGKSDQLQIFEKLFRAESAKQVDANGNGLGLYIAKSLAEFAGGEISFESELNKGSTFRVVWPVSPENRPYGVRPIVSQ